MFPNPDDAPAVFPQHPIHLAITGSIGREFLLPEGAIALRKVRMLRANMPESRVKQNLHYLGNSDLTIYGITTYEST